MDLFMLVTMATIAYKFSEIHANVVTTFDYIANYYLCENSTIVG